MKWVDGSEIDKKRRRSLCALRRCRFGDVQML